MTKEEHMEDLRKRVAEMAEATGMSRVEVLEMMKHYLTMKQALATKPKPGAKLGTKPGPGLPPNSHPLK